MEYRCDDEWRLWHWGEKYLYSRCSEEQEITMLVFGPREQNYRFLLKPKNKKTTKKKNYFWCKEKQRWFFTLILWQNQDHFLGTTISLGFFEEWFDSVTRRGNDGSTEEMTCGGPFVNKRKHIVFPGCWIVDYSLQSRREMLLTQFRHMFSFWWRMWNTTGKRREWEILKNMHNRDIHWMSLNSFCQFIFGGTILLYRTYLHI